MALEGLTARAFQGILNRQRAALLIQEVSFKVEPAAETDSVVGSFDIRPQFTVNLESYVHGPFAAIHRLSALPVPRKLPADRRGHRVPQNSHSQIAIALAAVIFQPCGMGGVLVKVLRRYEVMLAAHHAAQAGKEALSIIRMGAAKVAIGFLVVDPAHRVTA